LDASVISSSDTGHTGFVWGFNESKELLNHFTIPSDGRHCSIIQFQKDHYRVYHRFNTKIAATAGDTIRLNERRLNKSGNGTSVVMIFYSSNKYHLKYNDMD
jgi:hypothetical protein